MTKDTITILLTIIVAGVAATWTIRDEISDTETRLRADISANTSAIAANTAAIAELRGELRGSLHTHPPQVAAAPQLPPLE